MKKANKMLLGIKTFVGLITLLFFLFSCTGEEKETNGRQKQFSKKDEYVKPENINYDSASGTYTAAVSFDSINFYMGYIQAGSRSYICVNNAKLMNDSLLDGPGGKVLSLGDTVFIEHYLNTEYEHEYWSEPIYKVKVQKQGKEYRGYLPQNVIAIAVSKLSDHKMLLLHLADFVKGENYANDFYAEVLVMDSLCKILEKKSYKLIGGEQVESKRWHYYYTIEVKQLPAIGLDGAVDLISMNMNYPACGFMGGDQLLIWDGTKLHYAFQDYDASDAGVYYMSSYPVLPGDQGGKKNSILSITNTVSYEMSEEAVYKELEHDSLVIQYSWVKNKGIIKSDTLYAQKR